MLAVSTDRDEVVVIGLLTDVELDGESGSTASGAARAARITRFREETRSQRMRVANEAEHKFGRKVSWGARIGDQTVLFTTTSVPVMTRLRQNERAVLDTLVEAGVAKSRSDALAWCVKLVGANQSAWIDGLRDAAHPRRKVRAEGPTA